MKKKCAQHASSGFTLIELIMVIVVMGVLSAMVAPRFANKNTFEARFFRDDVLSALRFAQNHAKTTGCLAQFRITSTTFTISRDAGCADSNLDPATANYSVTVDRPGGGGNSIVGGIRIQAGIGSDPDDNGDNWGAIFGAGDAWVVTFLPDGSAVCNATHPIRWFVRFVPPTGRRYVLQVECATGYIHYVG